MPVRVSASSTSSTVGRAIRRAARTAPGSAPGGTHTSLPPVVLQIPGELNGQACLPRAALPRHQPYRDLPGRPAPLEQLIQLRARPERHDAGLGTQQRGHPDRSRDILAGGRAPADASPAEGSVSVAVAGLAAARCWQRSCARCLPALSRCSDPPFTGSLTIRATVS